MDAQWIKSSTGRRVLEHWADPRPAWLWSADGHLLLWRNTAARLFHGRAKGKDSRKPAETVPIRGQISRLIRLGSVNRASLSRMQFLVGDRPVSATCACTPLVLADGETGLLVVNVDPIAPELLDGAPKRDKAIEALFPSGEDYLLIDDDGHVASGSAVAIERYAPLVEAGLPQIDGEGHGAIDVEGVPTGFTRFKASPHEASLLLFEAAGDTAVRSPQPAEVLPPIAPPPIDHPWSAEPLLPMGLPPIEASALSADTHEPEDHWVEPLKEPVTPGGLSSLFDRLADDSALFAPLRPDEDFVPPEPAAPVAEPIGIETVAEPVAEAASEDKPDALSEPAEPEPVAGPASAVVADDSLAEDAALLAQGPATPPTPEQPPEPDTSSDDRMLYRIIGRYFTPITAEASADLPPAEVIDASQPDVPADAAPRAEAAAAPESPNTTEQPSADASLKRIATALAEVPAVTEPLSEAALETPAEHSESGSPEPIEAATVIERTPDDATSPPVAEPAGEAPPLDAENVERVSRYNFDELSRILNDRVGNGNGEAGGAREDRQTPFVPRSPLPSIPSATPEGALVTLGGETLVLNRLPLGILVFRDQQVLFANRAITQMIGYDSVESLRTAGLSAIFPSAGDEQPQAGPVNHLVQRDGALVPVTARLQSVSWQGKPALMLSASATEVRTGHEAAVRAFAELLAGARSDGFIEASRAGVLTGVSADARVVLGREEDQLIGRPISQLTAPDELPALREFFERPARFAETARPAITLKGADPGLEIMLFAQGQAGIVGGYFGFVRRTDGAPLPALAAPSREADPALLARLSRGVRRPLNTVIGFSDLIGSSAFGKIENERYLEYARDIKTAGLEIAALVDELDDFARLRDGRYAPRPTDLDLAGLLESSITRVRGQANTSRVLVRSAISERLPRVRADRASLAQAVLNLLASALDQTPQGGSVVLSAQVDDLGGVSINVRDSAQNIADLGERFVVFRDGVGRNGEALTPIRSSVGLALTRALLGVNGMTLTVDPTAGAGTLFSVVIPPESVVMTKSLPAGTP